MVVPQRIDERHGAVADEDEDLFDFPEIELTADGLREKAHMAAPAPAASFADRVIAPLPQNPASGVGSRISSPIPAELPRSSPAREPAAIGRPAGVAGALEAAEELPPRKRFAPSARDTWTILAALCLLNVFVVAYAWHASASLVSGITSLREELAASKTSPVERAEPEPQVLPPPIAPISVERDTLAMAEREIQAGDHAAARKRLFRLLAQVDRVNAVDRAEIEARASFLVADSYRVEAEARRGSKP